MRKLLTKNNIIINFNYIIYVFYSKFILAPILYCAFNTSKITFFLKNSIFSDNLFKLPS